MDCYGRPILKTSMVLEHTESMTLNELMFRLLYSKTQVSNSTIWNTIGSFSLIIQELEKYGLGFLEISPHSFVISETGEVRLSGFQGVIHPFIDLQNDYLITENLP